MQQVWDDDFFNGNCLDEMKQPQIRVIPTLQNTLTLTRSCSLIKRGCPQHYIPFCEPVKLAVGI